MGGSVGRLSGLGVGVGRRVRFGDSHLFGVVRGRFRGFVGAFVSSFRVGGFLRSLAVGQIFVFLSECQKYVPKMEPL